MHRNDACDIAQAMERGAVITGSTLVVISYILIPSWFLRPETWILRFRIQKSEKYLTGVLLFQIQISSLFLISPFPFFLQKVS